jgi:integrase
MSGWQVARSTKVDARACLSAIMRAAVKARLIPVNPCLGAELPREVPRDLTGRALSLDEVGLLLAELERKPAAWRRFILCLLFTGMRVGEVAGLLVADCDFEGGFIRVSKSSGPGFRGERIDGPTKNGRGRTVPIPAQLAPVLREACEGKGPHDLAFPGPNGGHVNSQNLIRGLGWRKLRDRVKTFPPGERPLRPHDLRHTAATTLFLAGAAAPDVMAILGHSSLQVTQLYANTRADAARRAVPLLSDYYASKVVTPVGVNRHKIGGIPGLSIGS